MNEHAKRIADALEALVEQQRIANLIALSARGYALEDGLTEMGNEAAYALVTTEPIPATPFNGPDEAFQVRPEIREALGLS